MKYQLLLDKAIKASRLAPLEAQLSQRLIRFSTFRIIVIRRKAFWMSERKAGEGRTATAGEQHVFAKRKSLLGLSPGSCPEWQSVKSSEEGAMSLCPPLEESYSPARPEAPGMLWTWEICAFRVGACTSLQHPVANSAALHMWVNWVN